MTVRNTIRRETPAVLGSISRGLAMPVLATAGIQYAMLLYRKPVSEVYPVALSTFGLTAALAGVCLSATGPIGSATTPDILRYAGEKFLHSAILLLQVLFVVFARDGLVAWLASHGTLKVVVTHTANSTAMLMMIGAVWSWYWALESLNDELWSNWRKRVGATEPVVKTVPVLGDVPVGLAPPSPSSPSVPKAGERP